jgi:hypothetical protein
MDKANNSPKAPTATPSSVPNVGITCGNDENNAALLKIRGSIDRLFTGCDPVIHDQIQRHLAQESGDVALMLSAWRKCGRADRGRSIELDLSETAKRTMSPLGLACLVAYAQAWLDETESRVAAIKPQTGQPVA